ncbi:ATP-binding protein [Paenibacillus sp. FSL L8-0709]|uniref:ATP-binding protein n=1 Tax=Paenibacillus sp. FSL L8-0709 TaxID=2975312 RepID=UPI0030F934F0
MEIVRLPNGAEAVVAEYKKQVIKDYEGNPFIEALPEILSPQHVIELLAHYPSFDPNERLLDPHLRIHLLQRLFQFFQPLGEHLQLYDAIATMIRSGYMDRNPFSPSYVKSLFNKDGEKEQSNFIYQSSTAKSLTLVGISGSGKTSSLARILALFPQIIIHSKYKGADFSRYQCTYLTIQAPYDASLKALCLHIFQTIDDLLGTEYMLKYGNGHKATNVMIPIIGSLLRNLGCGILLIDEIQHLSLTKGNGAGTILNFFTTLINTVNIPIVLVGTPKSMNLLQSEFRQARRGLSAHGNFFWDRLKRDEIWDLFLNGLWQYQWVKHPTELTDEISSVLYDETQGIPDVLVKLLILLQGRAISSGKETITVPFIRKVAKEQLVMVRPILDALKSGRKSLLLDYNDIVMPDIAEFINKEQNQIQVQTFIKESQQRTENRQHQLTNMKDEAKVRLQLMGFSEKQVMEYVNDAIKKNPLITDLNHLVQESYRLSMNTEREGKSKKETVQQELDNKDLRVIVQSGKKSGVSAYEALKQAGMIRIDFGSVG